MAVSTASDGRFTPTSCSRTLTIAFEVDAIVQVAGVVLAVEAGASVATEVGAP
jgi:hypothetical protein